MDWWFSAPRDDTARASCGNGAKANSYHLLHGNHDSKQLPILLLGGAGGNLRGGRVLDYVDQPNRRMCSLFLNLMDWGGLKLERFGDSNERLPSLA